MNDDYYISNDSAHTMRLERRQSRSLTICKMVVAVVGIIAICVTAMLIIGSLVGLFVAFGMSALYPGSTAPDLSVLIAIIAWAVLCLIAIAECIYFSPVMVMFATMIGWARGYEWTLVVD